MWTRIQSPFSYRSSSTPSRKRKLSEVTQNAEEPATKADHPSAETPKADAQSPAGDTTEDSDSPAEEENKRSDRGDFPEAHDERQRASLIGSYYDHDGYGYAYEDHDDYGFDCSSVKRKNRRTLYIEYWSRTDECKERKWDHLDEINEKYGAPEDHIFATTLNGRTAFLEPNMFPYDTPAGIEHWTLWHVKELSHEQVKQYVENWIDANAPHVESWNYDDNPERSIDIFHVHVYFQVREGEDVLQGRNVEDLTHEMD
ncbi:TPA: hypothetical protein N0F65_012151 [Lagenidium giganteum]|uniref:Uncharacterized protein n=1 Tax=Lagenidium giganteum TaxID=4803 RepID=A0AAV2YWV9_9STRA|nr:TPA: hypothetical protein N0F65_012151 [Lagenidium giganteum]